MISAQEIDNRRYKSDDLILYGVVACFFLSGFAALLYQTAWLRQFSIVFGTSELAVATILAAYMAGLAIGAAVAGRYVNSITRPVFVYGTLEAGIAVSALAVPFLLYVAGEFYSYLLGGQPHLPHSADIGQTMYYLCISFLILAIPTGFMGATLPLLTRYAVRSKEQIGTRVALLYSVNTAGAVFGTVITGFMLLPSLGLYWTVWVGISINFFVFLIAINIAKFIQPARLITNNTKEISDKTELELPVSFIRDCIKPLFNQARSFQQRAKAIFRNQPAWILPVMLFSGANAFLYEVLWTRLITHVLGGSVYAFATMLASFLTGIAIGSSMAGKFAADRNKAAGYFIVAQILISFFSVVVYTYLQQLVPGSTGYLDSALFCALVMLPSTVFIGATFPLAVRILTRDENDVSVCSAHVYAWNTIGAIVGAVFAGFYLIPELGFSGAFKFGIVINILLALWVLLTITGSMVIETVGLGVALFLIYIFYQPAIPSIVLHSIFPEDVETNRNIHKHFFAVGRSSTVLLTESNGRFNLRTNGLPESSVSYRGAPPARKSMQWLTALPLIMRPEVETMLVIGFGGGVAIQKVPDTVKEIDVVEIEPEVINANRKIGMYRSFDPLTDPRVNVVINDARNALQLTEKQYDVIVSQPSHPWTAGASHLYTREFIELSKSHLGDSGVFVQWMNSKFIDRELLGILSATLLDVFDYVRLYSPQPEVLLFVASDTPFNVDAAVDNSGRSVKDHLSSFRHLGLNSIEDLITILLVDETGLKRFARGSHVSTDNNNYMATQSRYRGDGLSNREVIELLSPYDPLLDVNNWLYKQYSNQLNFAYIAFSLRQKELMLRANNLVKAVSDQSTKSLIQALSLPIQGNNKNIYNFLTNAIREDPQNEQASFVLVDYYLTRLATDVAPVEIRKIAENLRGSAAAVVEGWKFSVNKDYPSLALLEPKLKEVQTTDLWYPKTLQLRAEWRIMLSDVEDYDHNLHEALGLIDHALLNESRISLYKLRMQCAKHLEEPEIYVETVRYLVQSIDEKLTKAMKEGVPLPKGYMRDTWDDLNELILQLQAGFLVPVKQRVVDVRAEINNLLSKINDQA